VVTLKRPREGRVTLLDVARAAGVSKTTASRILDERLPSSDNETARRVRAVAQELGYTRDVAAASLRRGQTMTIGVIVPRLTDTVMAMLYEAIARNCETSGRFAIVATTDDRPLADRQAAESLLRRGVDGLILATAREGDDYPALLAERGIPHVLALRSAGQSLASVGDDRLGGYLAARHLLDLGHTRFGVIAGPDYASSARLRVAGFLDALAEAGLPADAATCLPSTFGIDSGAESAAALLALAERPTAIFAVNDNTAIGALSTLLGNGIRVPEEMSLIGYNDIPIVSRLPIPLTTLRVPFDFIAKEALALLLDQNAAEAQPMRVSAPTLIPRKSTGRARP
jgi:LacI family transcriptional regulator